MSRMLSRLAVAAVVLYGAGSALLPLEEIGRAAAGGNHQGADDFAHMGRTLGAGVLYTRRCRRRAVHGLGDLQHRCQRTALRDSAVVFDHRQNAFRRVSQPGFRRRRFAIRKWSGTASICIGRSASLATALPGFAECSWGAASTRSRRLDRSSDLLDRLTRAEDERNAVVRSAAERSIVSFVRRLQFLSPDEYRSLIALQRGATAEAAALFDPPRGGSHSFSETGSRKEAARCCAPKAAQLATRSPASGSRQADRR